MWALIAKEVYTDDLRYSFDILLTILNQAPATLDLHGCNRAPVAVWRRQGCRRHAFGADRRRRPGVRRRRPHGAGTSLSHPGHSDVCNAKPVTSRSCMTSGRFRASDIHTPLVQIGVVLNAFGKRREQDFSRRRGTDAEQREDERHR